MGRYGISETFIFCFQPQTPFELLETTHINSISYFQTSKRAKRTTKYSIKRGLIAKFLYKRSFTIYSGSHGTTNWIPVLYNHYFFFFLFLKYLCIFIIISSLQPFIILLGQQFEGNFRREEAMLSFKAYKKPRQKI